MGNMIRLAAVLGVSALLLAACDDSDNGGSAGGGDPQDQFGATFAEAFDADGTDEAIAVEAGDAGELSLTDDPVDF